VVKKNLTFL